MLASLVLLLVFELVWLTQVYQDQRRNLKQQADLAFLQAIDEVQDSLMQTVFTRGAFLQRFPGKDSSPTNSVVRFSTFPSQKDTFQRDTTISISIDLTSRDTASVNPPPREHLFGLRNEGKEVSQVERSLRKVFVGPSKPQTDQPSSGLLSIWVEQLDGVSEDSLELFFLLQEEVQQIELGTPFTLQEIQENDKPLLPGLLYSRRYLDTPTDQSFALVLTDPRGYLLGQMWVEILFAILLFGLVTLAFGTIYRSLTQQQRLTQLKNDFIANVTHELKTPITTVRVALEALQNFDALEDPMRTREYLDISKQELDRLTLLVDRVLKMSLFERDKLILKPESIELSNLLSSIVATMQLQFRKHAAEVHLDIPAGEYWVNGDRLHLTNVIFNLLDNALKYSPQHPDIKLSLTTGDSEAIIVVRDKGIGIPAAYQEKIFEKFFRVPTGDRHDVKGHGLGLSYVAEVIRRHHGRVEVASQEGSGSTFSLYLPLN